MSYDVYTGLLKMFGKFIDSSSDAKLSYDVSSKRLIELKDKYSLDSIAGDGDDLSKTLNILFWLSDNTTHSGNYGNHISNNSLDLLEYAFKQGRDRAINCQALAIILSECLLSIGIMARAIHIIPFSPYDFDNHVITHAYIKSLHKWIILDPTYSSYVIDDENNMLDIIKTRKRLSNQEKILFNKEMNYNDEQMEDDSAFYTEYLAKDLFYFQTQECSKFYSEKDNRTITISPENFDVIKSSVYFIEHRIKHNGDNKSIQNWLKFSKENKLLYALSDELVKPPVMAV